MWDAREVTRHRQEPLLSGPARLWGGGGRPADVRGRRELEVSCQRLREHASLVEAALGPPPGRERHPGHGVGRRWTDLGQSGRERLPDPPPSRELQPMDGLPRRSPIRERRADGPRSLPAGNRGTDRRPCATAGRSDGTTAAPGGSRAAAHVSQKATVPRRTPRRPAGTGCRPPIRSPSRAPAHATARRRHTLGHRHVHRIGALDRIVTTEWVFRSGYARTDPAPVSLSKVASSTGSRLPFAVSAIDVSVPS